MSRRLDFLAGMLFRPADYAMIEMQATIDLFGQVGRQIQNFPAGTEIDGFEAADDRDE